MKEEWRDIEGYEGFYQVSNMGNVRSLDRKVVCKDGRVLPCKGRLLRPVINKYGYYQIDLWKNGYPTKYKVHRLVLQTFAPIEKVQHFEADHINHDPSDNRLKNLRWLTSTENNTRLKKGKRVGQYDKNGLMGVFASAYEAERRTGIEQANICRCSRGERKTAGGYMWRYYNA